MVRVNKYASNFQALNAVDEFDNLNVVRNVDVEDML